MTDITRRIDFATVTHHGVKHWKKLLPEWLQPLKTDVTMRPFPRYKTVWELTPAGRIDIAEDDQQGVMITLTGQDMSDLQIAGITFHQVVSEACRMGKVTRLDFATDIKQNPLADSPLWQDVQTYVANGAFRSSGTPSTEFHDKEKGGYTQYFGSYKSDQFVRVYDKAAQMGLLKQAMEKHIRMPHWTRFEVVTKGDYADNLAMDMMLNGWQNAGAAKLAKLLDFPLMDIWKDIISGEKVDLSPVSKKPSKWRKWMDTQVIQSIRQHAENAEDRAFLISWLQIVTNDIWNKEYGSLDKTD